jgi:hypothetical protein
VREALTEYLTRTGTTPPTPAAVQGVLLGQPYDDPNPDRRLSVDVDFYLYGARRRSRSRRRSPRASRRR